MKKILAHITPTYVLLALIMIGGAFFRLYNLQDSQQFLGDQGRDALIVSRIFKEGDLVFIGPVTSVGNMYLGPLYYYFMLPFLWLSYPSPMGPIYAVAMLGIITVALIYFLGKRMIGKRAALIASFFYAFSHIVIIYTRFSWNPNPAPLVSLLLIYFTYTAWKKHSWHWILVFGLLAVLLQLHYLTLLAAGGAGLIWLICLIERITLSRKESNFTQIRQLLIPTIIGMGIFILSFTPLVLFDLKHDWMNVKAFQNLLFGEENFKLTTDVNLFQRVVQTLREMHGRGMHILFDFPLGQQRVRNTILFFGTVLSIGWLLLKGKKRPTHHAELVLAAYLLTGIVGTALYEHTIFDHYISYLYPVTFLFYGVILSWLIKQLHWLGVILTLAAGIFFLRYNIPRMPIHDAGWTMTEMQTVAESIYQRIEQDEKYNIVLLSATGDIDAQNYRYFLNTTDKPPVSTEQRGSIETLFIINEDFAIKDVTSSPIYEIVVFPDKIPDEIYQIPDGPEITVLSTRNDQ